MTKQAHTPGPWRLETRDGVHRIIGPHHPAVGDPPVAFHCVYGRGQGHQDFIDECKANAHLIAASPALLEALKAMIAEFDKLTRYGSPMAKNANEAYRAANAAVDLAESQS